MSKDNSTTNSTYDNAIGLDTMHSMIVDKRIRHIQGYDGVMYLSLVDLMARFAPEGNIPRVYWNQQKKRLLSKDNELYQSLIQLRMPAEDGKMRSTDLAPLWACFFIVLLMDTPAATAFKKSVAKGMAGSFRTVAEIKYRAMNIANGGEWAADAIRAKMIAAGATGFTNLPE